MPSTLLSCRHLSSNAPPALALMALLILSPAPVHADEETPSPTPLAKLHARVERAFVRCDAGMLKPLLSPRFKTFVDTKALAPTDGYYGPDQMVLLFERLFEGRTTVSFKALAPDPKPRRDGRAGLPVRWISSGGNRSRSEISLILILASEGPIWRIREIRDLK